MKKSERNPFWGFLWPASPKSSAPNRTRAAKKKLGNAKLGKKGCCAKGPLVEHGKPGFFSYRKMSQTSSEAEPRPMRSMVIGIEFIGIESTHRWRAGRRWGSRGGTPSPSLFHSRTVSSLFSFVFRLFFCFLGGGYLIFGVIRKAIPTSYLFSFFCLFFLTVELGNRRNRFHQCWSLLLLLLLLSLLLLKMICWRKRSSCAMRRPVDVFVKRTTAASAT